MQRNKKGTDGFKGIREKRMDDKDIREEGRGAEKEIERKYCECPVEMSKF
jgi:hypothetical protein